VKIPTKSLTLASALTLSAIAGCGPVEDANTSSKGPTTRPSPAPASSGGAPATGAMKPTGDTSAAPKGEQPALIEKPAAPTTAPEPKAKGEEPPKKD